MTDFELSIHLSQVAVQLGVTVDPERDYLTDVWAWEPFLLAMQERGWDAKIHLYAWPEKVVSGKVWPAHTYWYCCLKSDSHTFQCANTSPAEAIWNTLLMALRKI